MNGLMLVVDDSSMMRMVVIRSLKQAGIEFDGVREAADGHEALAILRAEKVDLITCDINMPKMGGVELIQQMKVENLAQGVPVIMVTTEGSEPQVRQAILAGARGFIRKPFSVDAIRNSVKSVLSAGKHAEIHGK